MSDADKPKNWWQTLPGIMTGLAATLTAAAGLVVAVKQTGWLDSKRATVTAPSASSEPVLQAKPAVARPMEGASVREAAGTGAGAPAAFATPHSIRRLALPEIRDYTLQHKLGFQKATFTLLKAELESQTTETVSVKIRVRALNLDRYDMNFWARSFRLTVDGAPMAPSSELNELVASNSAKEADLSFIVPRTAQAATLKILHADQSTEIPLDLASTR